MGLIALLQQTADSFFAADLNEDSRLDFEEFSRIIPDHLTKDASSMGSMEEIFDMADEDGDGFISREEFFMWTLNWVQNHTHFASSLEACFRRYDVSGDHKLDLVEFRNALESFGFGNLADSVFHELDVDGSGNILYVELLEALRTRQKDLSLSAIRLLAKLSVNIVAADPDGEGFAASKGWTAKDANGLREGIKRLMSDSSVYRRSYDIWRSLLANAGVRRRLHRGQFHYAVRSILMFSGAKAVLDAAYDELDDDRTDEVGISLTRGAATCFSRRPCV